MSVVFRVKPKDICFTGHGQHIYESLHINTPPNQNKKKNQDLSVYYAYSRQWTIAKQQFYCPLAQIQLQKTLAEQ